MKKLAYLPTEHQIQKNIFPYYWKGKTHSDEYKKMMSKKLKGKKKTLEHRLNISRARKRIKLSEQTKNKIRNANLGKKYSEEYKRKMSEGHRAKGIHVNMTEEIKKKLSIAHTGKKLTKEHRKKQSDALFGRMPANLLRNGKYGNIERGKYNINGKDFFFRSKWEANYALYLDFLKNKKQIKSWKYETDVFIFHKIKFGTRSYRPDFKIFNNDGSYEYHEIKGYMDKKSATKLKRMKNYYPNIKIILIGTEEYKALNKWRKLLKFY